MKLHLPKALLTAALAASGIVGSHALAVAVATGTYKVTFTNGPNKDPEKLHDYTFTNEATTETAGWRVAASNSSQAILHFTADSYETDSDTVLIVKYNDFHANGFKVDAASKISGIGMADGDDRTFYVGHNNTIGTSEINRDFELSPSTGLTLAGTQTWTIAEAKTFTLKDGCTTDTTKPSITNNGTVTLDGSGSADFTGLTLRGSGRVAVNGGTLKNATVASGATLALGTEGALTGVTMDRGSILDLTQRTVAEDSPMVSSSNVTILDGTTICLSDVSDGETVKVSDTTLGNVLFIIDGNAPFASRNRVTQNAGSFTITAVGRSYSDMVWAGGTSGIWNKTAANWTSDESGAAGSIAFCDTDSVTFNSTASVTVAEGVTVGGMSVTGTGTVLNLASSNNGYVKGDVTISNGGKLVLARSGGATGLVRGSITVEAGSTLQFNGQDVTGYNGGANSTSSIRIEQGAELWLAHNQNESFQGTLTLNGTMKGTHANGSARWDLYGGSANLVVEAKMNARVENTVLHLRQSNSQITVGDDATLELGAISQQVGLNAILKKLGNGGMNVTGNAQFKGFSMLGGTAAFSGGITADTVTIESGSANFGGTVNVETVTVATDASFSLVGATIATSHTMSGSGTINLRGTNTFNGTLTVGGLGFNIEEGAVFGSGSLDSLNTLNEGNTTYSDGDNGYLSGLSYVLIADSSVGENQTLSYSTTGKLEGTTLKLVAGTGLVAETLGNSGAYYIRIGTVAYGGDNNAADKSTTKALILANGATVEINKELTVNLTTHGGTIQVNKDDNSDSVKNGSLDASRVTATADTTLTGNGNYKVTTNSLGSNIRLALGETGWKGTVTLSKYAPNDNDARNLRGLVNGTYSTLELIGYNGWTNPWQGSLDINFKLTDDGDTVAWKNGAFTSKTGEDQKDFTASVLEFTGKFSGSGTFQIHLDNTNDNAYTKMDYTFSGNIRDWDGKILKSGDANSTTNLTFTGSAADVNVDITKTGGALNVVAGVDGDGVTFHKNITDATSLLVSNKQIDGVNSGFTATLEGTATVDTLTLNAGATAVLSGDGNVTLGTTTAPGRLSFEVLQQGTAEAVPAIATLHEGGAAETPAAATGSIRNGGSAAVSFSSTTAGTEDTTYHNLNIKANSTSPFTLRGTLVNSAVENNNEGAITVSAPDERGSIAGLYANKGNIIVTTEQLAEAVSVDVGVLSVTQGKNISVTGTDATGGGTIETGDVRTVLNADAASSTASLTANLIVADGASLSLPTALDLGGHDLTFSGNIDSLTATYSNQLKALLFSNASKVKFGTDTTYAVADGQITLNGSLVVDQEHGVLLNGDVLGLDGGILLEVDGTSGALNVTHSVPEPGTATLGLLALAGLCARRRRRQ